MFAVALHTGHSSTWRLKAYRFDCGSERGRRGFLSFRMPSSFSLNKLVVVGPSGLPPSLSLSSGSSNCVPAPRSALELLEELFFS